MSARMDRGQSGSQVSSWMPSATNFTPLPNQSIGSLVPYGLRLRHTVIGCHLSTITANGTTMTCTTVGAPNPFVAGDKVSIVGAFPNDLNVVNATIATSSSTQFTISSSATTGSFNRVAIHAYSYFQIPPNITFVYAVVVGAGGVAITNQGGGGAGGITAGWTLASNVAIIGSNQNGFLNGAGSRYGHLNAGHGGNPSASGVGSIGAAGGGSASGAANYYGVLGGSVGTTTGLSINGFPSGAGAGGGAATSISNGAGGNGGSGTSGGGGGSAVLSTTAQTGGNGGNGWAGGGGGAANLTSGVRTGGSGGSGRGVDGTIYTGGTGSTGTGSNGSGGGGGGMLGNGANASGATGGAGGLGGGGGGAGATTNGNGGHGCVFIFY